MPEKADRPDPNAIRDVPAVFDATRLVESNQRAIRAALDAQSQGLRHMTRIGTSVFEFVQRRLKHDAELAEALGTAGSPEDACAAYHDFFETAVREYSDEFSALGSLYAEQTNEAMQDAERQVNEIARPILASAE